MTTTKTDLTDTVYYQSGFPKHQSAILGESLLEIIKQTLYEIVTKDDEIKSFRFETEKRKIQVSPEGYKDGRSSHFLERAKDSQPGV